MLIDSIEKNGNAQNNIFNIHIKLDTGMHRLGFEAKDLDQLIEKLNKNKNIRVRSVFSHLTSSDDPGQDDFSRKQIDEFFLMSKKITASMNHPVLLHILNSAGITRFPEAVFDMVRLGISLYGISEDNSVQEKLLHVGTLKSAISQIKHVRKGETIGYNRQWTTDKETVIATIPVGYADGLNRKLSNGKGSLIINKQPATIIGNICMDMCMADITGIEAKEGDEVIIFGKEYPITKMADALDTIPYEILTSIPQRVKRVYFRE
jgi:alanine racemase